ncbi:MAG: class II D-tagatose-bisphosphate aldolase, non-catalytic subunit, partial [Oscillospiraceae bacterium]|nr:class II D-tagatose-bisphosphate aldolase, non-catalytic subunit [Oscillospiraceae bacterium]
MVHPIKKIISEYKNGNHKGIFSVCSANKYVIEAAMERLRSSDMYLLIESTANQVDQFGGYTRMRPMDFKNFIKECCTCFNFPFERVILGGDHLGPLTWQKIDPEEAMENAKELIRQYVLAGFTKIHIDTSMKLFGDDVFGDEKIADRAGILCTVAEESFKELSLIDKDALHPVYIIGSEVPIPGGAKSEEENSEGIQVTKVGGFKQTVETFKLAFENHGVKEAFDYVVGVVVQPGVEFSSDTVWEYDEDKAKDLSETIKSYSNLVYEAHS